MLCYFLNIMRQKSFVCVQLLQTLNILFENIRNETSLCKRPFDSISEKDLCILTPHLCFRLLAKQQPCQFNYRAQV